MRPLLFLSLLLSLILPVPAAATAEQSAVFETSFTSDRSYGNPFMEVQVDVTFQTGDQQWLVPAFWAGGDKWTSPGVCSIGFTFPG